MNTSVRKYMPRIESYTVRYKAGLGAFLLLVVACGGVPPGPLVGGNCKLSESDCRRSSLCYMSEPTRSMPSYCTPAASIGFPCSSDEQCGATAQCLLGNTGELECKRK